MNRPKRASRNHLSRASCRAGVSSRTTAGKAGFPAVGGAIGTGFVWANTIENAASIVDTHAMTGTCLQRSGFMLVSSEDDWEVDVASTRNLALMRLSCQNPPPLVEPRGCPLVVPGHVQGRPRSDQPQAAGDGAPAVMPRRPYPRAPVDD